METLEAGATFYGLPKFDVDEMWRVLVEDRPNRLVGVPTMLEALCRTALEHDEILNSPLRITTAGAKLEADLIGRLTNVTRVVEVTDYYGASELGFVTTTKHQRNTAGQLEVNDGSAGNPFPGVVISIRENGRALDAGKDGMILVDSPLVIEDYLFGGDGSGFRRDGDWASVGDIGRLTPAGKLTLLGRSGGMAITGGNNVYPEEIVTHLRRLECVNQALVVGTPDQYLGQMLVAVIGLEPGNACTAKELSRHCERMLPRYKVPRKFYMLDAWPMTTSGKIATGTIAEWINANDQRLRPL
jgi:long-chain acyl-CoA synthetase